MKERKENSQVWWYTLVILVLVTEMQEVPWGSLAGQPRLVDEFQASGINDENKQIKTPANLANTKFQWDETSVEEQEI